jgi:BirA family biotin operon repressor/biotin-[acetyl-CoA-carboxylase] ligase
MQDYTPTAIKSRLTTNILGRRIELHPQVGSTNDLVKQAARLGEAEGLVVLAEEQVAGRGRLGRTWVAPPGCCVLCSVLLRPRFSPQQAFYVTIAAAVAIHRALRVVGGGALSSAIKWSNDVLLDGRKVAGILSESEFSGGGWAFSVLGFGINVNLEREQFGALRDTATSLSAELGREVDRVEVLARVLAEFESLYLLLQGGQFGPVHAEWAAALETLGKRVSIAEPGSDGTGSMVQGRALRVDADGALVVLTDGGVERRVLAGDVLPS